MKKLNGINQEILIIKNSIEESIKSVRFKR